METITTLTHKFSKSFNADSLNFEKDIKSCLDSLKSKLKEEQYSDPALFGS